MKISFAMLFCALAMAMTQSCAAVNPDRGNAGNPLQDNSGNPSQDTAGDNAGDNSEDTTGNNAGDNPSGEIAFEEEIMNVENDYVRNYLATATSTFLSSNKTSADFGGDDNQDRPAVHKVNFGVDGALVTLASDPAFNEASILLRTVADKEFSFVNLIPGGDYYYKVEKDGRLIRAAKLTVTGLVRMIYLEDGFNIRDLGGWTGLGGKTVRYGLLYRGGSLGGTNRGPAGGQTLVVTDIGEATKAELKRLGINAHLDLRAATNSGKYIAGEYSNHSYARNETTIPDADYNNTMADYGAYNEDASLVSAIAWIILELRRGKSVYFNCRQGADRTGAVAFLLECLLGCYDQPFAPCANQLPSPCTNHPAAKDASQLPSPCANHPAAKDASQLPSPCANQTALDYELTGFSGADRTDNIKMNSYRGAPDAYSNHSKIFYRLLNLEVPGVGNATVQQKAYYYLNGYWKTATPSPSSGRTLEQSRIAIGSEDLDWLICKMLDMSSTEYSPFCPSWAQANPDCDLRAVAEANANILAYTSDSQPVTSGLW